jgi:hypothetical protein
MIEPCDAEENEYEADREGSTRETSGEAGAILLSLRLRSARAARVFGGRSSFAMLLVWISDSEPDDWRIRGRRLRAFGGTLWDACAAVGLSGLRATVPGTACGIHSSLRSSSHGWVVLAMVVSRGRTVLLTGYSRGRASDELL